MKTIIRNPTIVTASDTFVADVLIDNGTISAVGVELDARDATVVDGEGKYLLPGGIDVHTHLDMPFGGTKTCDDFYTGHVAAAFGGTTTHIDFAIQPKGGGLKDALNIWHEKARDKAVIDYGFHVIVTELNDQVLAEIAELPAQGVTSIKMFMAYKGILQVDDDTLFKAFEMCRDVGVLPMVHAENGCAIDVLVKHELAKGHTDPIYHALSRPPQLEGEATGRAIALAEVAGSPLFIVHMTCEESLGQLRAAQDRGSKIYGESCTHYMFFTLHDLDRPDFEGAKWVCSPPFREKKDQEAIWKALRNGTLSVVSTDHCAFKFDGQKNLGRDDFSKIPNGVPGIEERMMVMHQGGVNDNRFSLNQLVALTATNPAKLFGLEGRKGSIAAGYDADLVLWDFKAHATLSKENLHSAVDYTLYEGHVVKGVPQKVWVRGELVVDGETFLGQPGNGKFQPRKVFEV